MHAENWCGCGLFYIGGCGLFSADVALIFEDGLWVEVGYLGAAEAP